MKTKKPTKEVHVAFASDDNYAQHLAVAIASLLLNSKSRCYIKIHVLISGFTERSKVNIESLVNLRTDTSIEFIDVPDHLFSTFPKQEGIYPTAAYFRLALSNLVANTSTLIYLDSDIVVCDDIEKIWPDQDFEADLVGAVEEPFVFHQSRKGQFGMNPRAPYHNSGVLLLNLTKMKKIDFFALALKHAKKYEGFVHYPDQDIFNAITQGQIRCLPLRWNSFFYVLDNVYLNKYRCYTKSEILEARSSPAIVHYNQHPKPWSKGCVDPRRGLYFRYLAHTPYKDFKLDDSGRVFAVLKEAIRRLLVRLRFDFPILYGPARVAVVGLGRMTAFLRKPAI